MGVANPAPAPILNLFDNQVSLATASPAAWTDLDLSAIVGARLAKVRLAFQKTTHVGNSTLCVRPNGVVRNWDAGGMDHNSRSNLVPNTGWTTISCKTDAAGIIEWIDSAAGEAWNIYVLEFITE